VADFRKNIGNLFPAVRLGSLQKQQFGGMPGAAGTLRLT
jgi:hypothetical protein